MFTRAVFTGPSSGPAGHLLPMGEGQALPALRGLVSLTRSSTLCEQNGVLRMLCAILRIVETRAAVGPHLREHRLRRLFGVGGWWRWLRRTCSDLLERRVRRRYGDNRGLLLWGRVDMLRGRRHQRDAHDDEQRSAHADEKALLRILPMRDREDEINERNQHSSETPQDAFTKGEVYDHHPAY